MRPNNETVKTESNMQGTEIYVSLDEESQPHLMSLFTDMYKDRIQATAREYMANALDSHRAAGQTRPIEVYLPTPLQPTFRVKDWGVGLDTQDIIDVVSKYGASTKRETDDQDGCLGLGCKSALTYSPQFTYIGIKNGIKTIVLTSRDESNRVKMTVLDPTPTDEHSGVEVSVPVQPGDAQKFEIACKAIMQYWPDGVALLNGKEVPKIKRDQVINDNLFLVRDEERYRYESNNFIVVMGNIPYKITDAQVRTAMEGRKWQLPNYHKLIAYVPMGSVHFEPSREGLRDTSLTMNTLKDICQNYEDNIVASMQRDMDKCASRPEAMTKCFELESTFRGFPRPKYRGQEVPVRFKYRGKLLSVTKLGYYMTQYNSTAPADNYAWRTSEEERTCEWSYNHNGVYVDGFNIEKWTRRHLDKLLAILRDRGLIGEPRDAQGNQPDAWREFQQKPLVICEEMPDEAKEWVNGKWIVSFDELREYKLPTRESAPKREKYAGQYIDANNWCTEASDLIEIERDGKLFHVETRQERRLSDYYTVINSNNLPMRHYRILMETLVPDCKLMCIPANRVKKYERTFPNSVPMLEYIEKEFKATKKTIGKRVAGYITLSRLDGIDTVAALPAKKLLDPELRAVSNLRNDPQVKQKANDLVRKREMFTNVQHDMDGEIEDSAIRSRYASVIEKYPLLKSVSQPYREEINKHLVIYVNAVYSGKKG